MAGKQKPSTNRVLRIARSTPLGLARYDLANTFTAGHHLQVLSSALVLLGNRQIDRLLVLMPPQHGKSSMCSLYFPAWYMSIWHEHDVILAAYESSFAADWGRRVRNLFRRRGRELFGLAVDRDQSARNWWGFAGQAGRMAAVGLDGAVAGKPARLLVVDDPVKNDADAHSPVIQQRVWNNYLTVGRTRLQPDGVQLLVMTHWAKGDLAGRILDAEGDRWHVIRMPALALAKDPLGRKPGEALWPERGYTREWLEETRSVLGDYHFEALYQQQPQPGRRDIRGLISWSDVQACARQAGPKVGQPDIGADIARAPTGDRNVFAIAWEDQVEFIVRPGQDTTITTAELIDLIKRYNARSLRIDDSTFGGGVTDNIRKAKREISSETPLGRCRIYPFSFGGKAHDPKRFFDKRTELWWHLSQEVEHQRRALPADPELYEDLTAPMMIHASTGKLRLEPKDSMARRGIRSPDFGDAAAMAMYPKEWMGPRVWSMTS